MIDNNTRFLGVDSSKVNLTEKKDSINNAVTEYYTAEEIGAFSGGGLEGTQYVFVNANGTDVENAAELQAAYDLAKTMSPSATNRITVVAAPGNYKFSSTFEMDTEFIDLVSLDGNRSIVFNGLETISITSNDVFVKGVDAGNNSFMIGSGLNLLKVENCKGSNFSFGPYSTASGTFINCQAGFNSFGSNGTASGTFTNCSGDSSFGSSGGIASGIFTNCSGYNSFGSNGTASGTFTNCSGDSSFGSNGTASGTFTNCQGGDSSFGAGGTASGTFINCQGLNASFGGNGDASGTFTNCVGGNESFGGGLMGTLQGYLYYCRLTSGQFQLLNGAPGVGVTRLCIDGSNNENNQG